MHIVLRKDPFVEIIILLSTVAAVRIQAFLAIKHYCTATDRGGAYPRSQLYTLFILHLYLIYAPFIRSTPESYFRLLLLLFACAWSYVLVIQYCTVLQYCQPTCLTSNASFCTLAVAAFFLRSFSTGLIFRFRFGLGLPHIAR